MIAFGFYLWLGWGSARNFLGQSQSEAMQSQSNPEITLDTQIRYIKRHLHVVMFGSQYFVKKKEKKEKKKN